MLNGKVKVVKSKSVIPKLSSEQITSSKSIFHRRKLIPQENLVFVLMPFTESWSDYIWKKQIKPTVESTPDYSLICKRADDLFGQDVMQDIYESIVCSKIIIAEITGRNANVFYELGIAHTLGKKVILLTQGQEHIPFDLNRYRHCIYADNGPGYELLQNYLTSTIVEILNPTVHEQATVETDELDRDLR